MNLDNESRLAMITYRQEKSMNKSHADTSTEVHRQSSKGKDTKSLGIKRIWVKKLRKSCKYQKKYLSLQRERNLFMFAPVGPASD